MQQNEHLLSVSVWLEFSKFSYRRFIWHHRDHLRATIWQVSYGKKYQGINASFPLLFSNNGSFVNKSLSFANWLMIGSPSYYNPWLPRLLHLYSNRSFQLLRKRKRWSDKLYSTRWNAEYGLTSSKMCDSLKVMEHISLQFFSTCSSSTTTNYYSDVSN